MVCKMRSLLLNSVLCRGHADMAREGTRKVGGIVETHGACDFSDGQLAGCQQEPGLLHPPVLYVLVGGAPHGHSEQPDEMIAAHASDLGQVCYAQVVVNAVFDQVKYTSELSVMNVFGWPGL